MLNYLNNKYYLSRINMNIKSSTWETHVFTRHSLKKLKKVTHPMVRPERESNLAPLDCRSSSQTTKLSGFATGTARMPIYTIYSFFNILWEVSLLMFCFCHENACGSSHIFIHFYSWLQLSLSFRYDV